MDDFSKTALFVLLKIMRLSLCLIYNKARIYFMHSFEMKK